MLFKSTSIALRASISDCKVSNRDSKLLLALLSSSFSLLDSFRLVSSWLYEKLNNSFTNIIENLFYLAFISQTLFSASFSTSFERFLILSSDSFNLASYSCDFFSNSAFLSLNVWLARFKFSSRLEICDFKASCSEFNSSYKMRTFLLSIFNSLMTFPITILSRAFLRLDSSSPRFDSNSELFSFRTLTFSLSFSFSSWIWPFKEDFSAVSSFF